MEQNTAGADLILVARYMTVNDWMQHREQITRLYRDEKKTLEQTRDAIETEHGVKATVKMWKNKITEWRLDKKNKKDDVLAMLRKKTEREAAGKGTVFKLRGHIVDFKAVQSYATRNRISEAAIRELVAARPQTPPDLQCLTPEPVPRLITGRDVCHKQELILRQLDEGIVGSFEQKLWTATPDGSQIWLRTRTTSSHREYISPQAQFNEAMRSVANLLSSGNMKDAVLFLSLACNAVKDLVHQANFLNISECFWYIIKMKDQEAESIIPRQFSNMVNFLLPPDDLRRWLYDTLGKLEGKQLEALLPMLHKLTADRIDTLVGEYNSYALAARIRAFLARGSHGALQDWLCQMLRKTEDAFGPLEVRSILLLRHKALSAFRMSDYAVAEEECREVLYRVSLWAVHFPEQNEAFHLETLSILSRAQILQGNYLGAIDTLNSQLAMAESSKANSGNICGILNDLEMVWRCAGNLHEAEQIRAHKIYLLNQIALS